MENNNIDPKIKQQDADLDDPTKSFKNSRSEHAAEINRGDPKSKTYKGEGEAEVDGPNYDKLSEGSEGDTGQNAGIFK
ncbi:hypothetical protein KXD93_19340 [Mucilaginibacter sp. BJC16-A38]|uniref:hypothetical protein n=1 Tax=Mucilaginibacter phenanthrenivorans TaxID=1234842 RepID=UPI002157E693|nr:hypothetical protein [Mucilaginibacter phenanthrenivorans]MCR8559813.1 hypothetical protein [Mucilaginibacter phenanthrenivorans]